ncbi:MAG: 30S ribosomal protein S1 [Eubacteriales bacterium]
MDTSMINDGMSFEEMLDASFKTLRTGERVKGTVTSVTPTEVHVDLGIKYTGMIPLSELSDDPTAKTEDLVKVGDEIDVVVVKPNDAEGTILLSKKRIDADKNWDALVEAEQNGTVLTGKVIELTKGGLVMISPFGRVFIPISQTTLPRREEPYDEKDLAPFAGQTLEFKVIGTDARKKRAVGSIRAVATEKKKAAEAKFWETAEVGQTFTGKVKSITSYGAFVDLGPVDGMVHITELSWKRIKNPSEVVKVGEEIDVYIKALDPEKKRISLGHKMDADNPWTILSEKYSEGDVVDVKIVSLTPFGAFAEVIPGIDGLIHISQIADHKIAKPADELSVGEVVKAKITAIDYDAKKVSLSIRALLEAENAPEEEAAEEAADAE